MSKKKAFEKGKKLERKWRTMIEKLLEAIPL